MTDLLSRLFVKDYKNVNDPSVRAKYGSFASIVGIVVNLIISSVKLIVGVLSASISITADAVNNLTDAGSSVISLIGFKLSSKPADRDHPFGHARIEYISSMIVSFIILLVGADLLTNSVKSLIFGTSSEAELGVVSFAILGFSILGKLWLALFSKKIGKRINSTSLKAAGTDALSDVASTTAVLISAIIMTFTNLYWLDAAMGLVVSVIILIAGIKILGETKNSILGECPTNEIEENMRKITAEYPEIIGIHDLMIHNYGPSRFVASFHAEVDGYGDIFELHDTIDLIEKRIGDELRIPCTIHLDPIDTHDETVARLKALAEEAVKSVYPAVTIHDFRIVTGKTHTNLIFDAVVPFEEKDSPALVKEKIAAAINEKDNTLFSVIAVDRG